MCSDPGGVAGEGFHLGQQICYVAAIRDRTLRRISKKFENAKPDVDGFQATDGVSISIDLMPHPSEDFLGIEPPSESAPSEKPERR